MKLLCAILFSVLVLTTSSRIIDKNPHSSSEAPSADCNTIIFDMIDCVSFLNDGSKDQKPKSSCCTGLASVLSADPKCLCVAIKSSGDMGVELNLTRAAELPKACGLSAPPLGKCDLSKPPSAAPGKAPSHSPDKAPSPGKAPSHSPAEPPSHSPMEPPSKTPDSPPSESPDTPPSESPDSPPSGGAPQPSAEAPSDDIAVAPSPKSQASHSLPAISTLVISFLLLTFSVGFSLLT